jgi:hypothetical protein
MMAISDGVVIGVVLGLVFTAVCYYLYNRQAQLERKVGLMENILLDLKVTTEQTLLSATEPREPEPSSGSTISYESRPAPVSQESGETREIAVEQPSRVRTPPASVQVEREEEQQSSVQGSTSASYDDMTYKQLQQLAKQRGISGLRNVSKAQVIEALAKYDSGGGTGAPVPLTSWKEEEGEMGTSIEALSSAQDQTSGLTPIDATSLPEASLVSSD